MFWSLFFSSLNEEPITDSSEVTRILTARIGKQGLMYLEHLYIMSEAQDSHRPRASFKAGLPQPLAGLQDRITHSALPGPQAFGPWPEGMSRRSYLEEKAKLGSQMGWGSVPACC